MKNILFVFGVAGSGYVEDIRFLGWNSICHGSSHVDN